DLPEHRLTQVVIVDLPLPPNDPLFAAKRRHAQSPFEEVDLPFMQLRLRQGMGRLIRTERDAGVVTLLVTAEQKDAWQSYIDPLFPVQIDWNE
ncbi:MAG TPA: helicase C-terminal domain-containing protein, partial [Savagea sp.]